MNIDILDSHIKSTLSEKRYKHSLGVAETSKKLAAIMNADEEKAYIAGLLHDCAKEIPYDQAFKKLKDYGIVLDEITLNSPPLLHGPLGACIVKNEFCITDPEIFDAIWFHTTGKSEMSVITKIVYLADYIEPNRKLDGIDKLRELAFDGNIDQAIVKAAGKTIKFSLKEGRTIHPDTIHARNYILLNSDNFKK